MRLLGLSRGSSRVLLILLGIILLLLIINVLGQLVFQFDPTPSAFTVDLIDRFNVDKELSVPTWFASFLALLTALAAFANAKLSATHRTIWGLLGGLFLLISLDETAALHELALQGLHIVAGFGETQTFEQNAWLLIMPLAAAALTWIVWQARSQLPSAVFFGLAVGLGVYVLGAVVVEFAAIEVDKVSLSYRFGYTVVEEGLEFLGTWLMLAVTLRHFETAHGHMLKRFMEK